MDSSDEKVLLESCYLLLSSGVNQKKREKDRGLTNIYLKE